MNFLAQTVNRGGAFGRAIARKTREVGFLEMSRQGITKLMGKLRSVGSRDPSSWDAFDSKYGTDTAKIVDAWALDIPANKVDHASRYETVVPEVFSATLTELKISHDQFVFIDLGSGKGRTLLLASFFPFKKIVGVEISARLHTVANQNLRVFKDGFQKCNDIQSVCQDVMDYEFPQENVVLYLYNPFDEQVMQSVVSKVEDFIRQTSKRVYVLYHNPRHRSVWDGSKSLRMIQVQDRYAVYASFGIDCSFVLRT